MARKARTHRPRPTVAPPGGATQVLEPASRDERPPAAAAPTLQRARARVAGVAPAPADYTYVKHDVIRIAIITFVLLGGMAALALLMR